MYNQKTLNKILKDAGDITEETRQLIINAYRQGADAHRYQIDIDAKTILNYKEAIISEISNNQYDVPSWLAKRLFAESEAEPDIIDTIIFDAHIAGYIEKTNLEEFSDIKDIINRIKIENIMSILKYIEDFQMDYLKE